MTLKRRCPSSLLSCWLSCCLVAVLWTNGHSFSVAWAQEEAPQQAAPPDTAAAPEAPEAPAPLSSDELDQLVAPIALYPDALVAQILAGSTYPTEVVEAARWQSANPGLRGDDLAAAVDSTDWDPSIKALTQFPSVLANMNNNLSWTSALGQAYYYQPEDVLSAVQVMRRRALAARTLVNTRQQRYVDQDDMIMIEPVNPDEVYVPQYNPGVIYGAPEPVYPGYSTGEMIGAGALAFGAGVAVGMLASRDWGWHRWNTDWHHHDVVYQNNVYVSNSNTFSSAGGYGGGGRGGNFNRPGGNNRQGGYNAPAPGRPQRGGGAGYRPGAPANRPANENPQMANRGPGEMGAPAAAGHPSGGAGAGYRPGTSGNRPADANPQTANRAPREMGAPAAEGHPSGGAGAGYRPGAPANRPANANTQVTSRGPREVGAPAAAPPPGAGARPAYKPSAAPPVVRNNPRPQASQPSPYRGFAKTPATGLNKTAFARIAPGGEAIAASARGRASLGHAPAPPRPAPPVHAAARPAPAPHPAAPAPHPAAPAPHPAAPAAPAPHKH